MSYYSLKSENMTLASEGYPAVCPLFCKFIVKRSNATSHSLFPNNCRNIYQTTERSLLYPLAAKSMLPSVNNQFTPTVSSQNSHTIRHVKYEILKYNVTDCFRIMQQ